MKIGDVDVTISPKGWIALAAAAAKALQELPEGRGFRKDGDRAMAWKLSVLLVPEDSTRVKIEHVFYGMTRAECVKSFEGHQQVCGSFGPAVAEGRSVQEWEEIEEDDIPEVDDEDDGDDEEDDDEK